MNVQSPVLVQDCVIKPFSVKCRVPIFHECQRCTACCRWLGQVRLTDAEITRIAAHLDLSETDFVARHTRVRPDRRGLSLLEKPNGECEFLVGNDCAIQPVKPQQCREFPNLWNFPGFEKVCHAVPRDLAPEEWRQRIKAATGRDAEPGVQLD